MLHFMRTDSVPETTAPTRRASDKSAILSASVFLSIHANLVLYLYIILPIEYQLQSTNKDSMKPWKKIQI